MRIRWIRRLVLFSWAVAFAAIKPETFLSAQEAAPMASLVGKRVWLRYGATLQADDGKTIDLDLARHRARGRDRQTNWSFKVERAEGDRLWIVAEDSPVKGWIQTSQAMTLEQALDEYNGRIRDDPAAAKNYIARGLVKIRLGKLDEALADYDEGIRRDPDSIGGLQNRGLARLARGDFDGALADFNEVVRLDPAGPDGFIARGKAWAEKEERKRAIADFTEALRLDPTNALAYADRGVAYAQEGERDKAIADYTEAIRLAPEDPDAFINRGVSWFAMNECAKALADVKSALDLHPANAFALNFQAWIRATADDPKIRDGRLAVRSATRACEIDSWKDPYDLRTLAAAEAERGDFDAAVKWQEKAIELMTRQKVSPATISDAREWLDQYRQGKPYRQ